MISKIWRLKGKYFIVDSNHKRGMKIIWSQLDKNMRQRKSKKSSSLVHFLARSRAHFWASLDQSLVHGLADAPCIGMGQILTNRTNVSFVIQTLEEFKLDVFLDQISPHISTRQGLNIRESLSSHSYHKIHQEQVTNSPNFEKKDQT